MKPERWQQIDKILEAALEQEAGASRINVVLNWFEELKRLVPTN